MTRTQDMAIAQKRAGAQFGLTPAQTETVFFAGQYGFSWGKVDNILVFSIGIEKANDIVQTNFGHFMAKLQEKYGMSVGGPVIERGMLACTAEERGAP